MTIGVSNLPNLRMEHFAARGCRFNMMVIGSKGLGKTTLINNIIGKPIISKQPFNEGANDKFWYDRDLCNIQISRIELLESEFSLRMEIIEVDGVGDQVNNYGCYEPIVDVLKARFNDYQQKLFRNVKNLVDDTRIHLCLYMLEPLESIKASDLETLKNISQFCNIIPIVAKSDLLNGRQINNIRAMLRDSFVTNDIDIYDDSNNGFEGPYFVSLGSQINDEISNVRKYPWGVMNLLEMKNNDFFHLREFILEKALVKLISKTDNYFDAFKITQLAEQLLEKGQDGKNASLLKKIEDNKNELIAAKLELEKQRAELKNSSRSIMN